MKLKLSRPFVILITLSFLAAPLAYASEVERSAMPEMLRPLKGKQFDAAFVDAMSQHHQEAVAMATLASSNAQSPGLKKMAEKMVAKQTAEISQLAAWRSQLADASGKMGDMHKMGELHKKQMAMLNGAKGDQFDKMFLDLMSHHHQDAIEMARLADGRSAMPEIQKFAASILKDQEREVSEMKEMMKS